MANYFTNNSDLLFQFERLRLEEVVAILEHDYTEARKFEGAPQNYDEALDIYRSSLELVGDISANFVAPRAESVDREGVRLEKGKVHYAKGTLEAFKQLAEAGLMGVIVPRKYGGINFPSTIYMMMIEMISRADASLMLLFGYQDVAETISRFGTEEQGFEFLPKYIKGEYIGATALTEPGGGSDLQTLKTEAYQDEAGNWYLRGAKRFISNGNGDVILVLARSEPDTKNLFGLSLFVCHGDDTIKVSRVEEKMGLHGSPTCELYFEDTPAQLIGRRRYGLMKYVLYILNHARFSVAAQALGIAEAAYEEALNWAKERFTFGSVIYQKPPIANMLIDMRVKLESCRTLLYASAQWLDLKNQLEERIEALKAAGKPRADEKAKFDEAARMVDMLSPLVKYIVTEAANEVCYDALQIHGGTGYMRESKIERLCRDVRITSIYEGASQVQIIGASKEVFSDILKDFFAGKKQKNYTGGLSQLAEHLKEIRQIFLNCVELINDHEDARFREIAAKDLVDMYTCLYTGYLLLDESEVNERKVLIANRYIVAGLSRAHQSFSVIKNDRYADLIHTEEICSGKASGAPLTELGKSA